MSEKILVIDTELSEELAAGLQTSGFEIRTASDKNAAEEALRCCGYSVIIIDPATSGTNVCEFLRLLRSQCERSPVIVLSDDYNEEKVTYVLNTGADLWLKKPIGATVLCAQINALIRRSNMRRVNPMLNAGPFSYNTSTLRLKKNGVEIALSAKENALIKLFLDNINHVFTKEKLYELIWGETVIDENAIMVYINRLRQKIEDNPGKPGHILNVRGVGYRFVL